MEVRKIKILLEDYISRLPNSSYGMITAETIDINIFLTQEIKDLGMYINDEYIPYDVNYSGVNYTELINKLGVDGYMYNFINQPFDNFTTEHNNENRVIDKYYNDYLLDGIIITGITEDRLENTSSYGYNNSNKYVPSFNLDKKIYQNYKGITYSGVSEVISINDFKPIIYTEDANINDPNYGTILQSEGILLKTYSGETINNIDDYGNILIADKTEFNFQGQYLNETNSSLSAITSKEYLLHITQPPKVESDLFIDRGITNVIQTHLQLGEITNLEQLTNYGNGFYNINK